MFTLKDYLNGRDILYPNEWNNEKESNATILLDRVNRLLDHLGYKQGTLQISSGFRPSVINSKAGGSAKSGHLSGKAIDIKDPSGLLKKEITKELLIKFDLYMEHPIKTPTWAHLDISKRTNRIFMP